MTMWYIQTVERYSSLRRNEILLHVLTRMDFEGIMLSNRSPPLLRKSQGAMYESSLHMAGPGSCS